MAVRDVPAAPESEVRGYYEAHPEKFTEPPQTRVGLILLSVDPSSPTSVWERRREEAQAIHFQITEGADFAELAKEHSAGPSGPNGGDLGFFEREGAMVEPFAKAAFELEEGQVSDLVETQFGLHIIRVTGRMDGRVLSLDEASAAIRRRLEAERVAVVRPEHLEKLRSETTIERL